MGRDMLSEVRFLVGLVTDGAFFLLLRGPVSSMHMLNFYVQVFKLYIAYQASAKRPNKEVLLLVKGVNDNLLY